MKRFVLLFACLTTLLSSCGRYTGQTAFLWPIIELWTTDTDGDGVRDDLDNCPYDSNPDQAITAPDNTGLNGDACAFDHYATIAFDTTGTGANISADQVNFPILIRLTGPMIVDTVDVGAPDIRFVDGSIPYPQPGPYLSYEIEEWDQDANRAAVWVLVPRIYGNDNSHTISMYYDDSLAGAVADAQSTGRVFGSTNDYAAVWHLNDLNDATTNAHHGTNSGTTVTSGHIGQGRYFDGSSYIDIVGTLGNPANLTLSAWAQLDARDTTAGEVVSLGDHATLRMDEDYLGGDNGTIAVFYAEGIWHPLVPSPRLLYVGTGWHYLSSTFDDTNNVQKLYIDGEEKASLSITSSLSYSGLGSDTNIGRHAFGGVDYDFIAIIDEVRVSNTPRSADWIKLEYENQKAAQTLVTVTVP